MELDGSSYFTVEAANNPLANATQFTMVVVFEALNPSSGVGGGWYQSSGLVGMEQANSVADWGLGWNNDRVSAGVGGPDVTMFSPPTSYPQAVVAMFTWSGGVQRLYVNGVLVDSDYFVTTAARNPGKFAIGAITEGGGNPFAGRLAEVRLYDTDESTNAAAIYSALRTSYFGSLQLVSKKITTTGGNFVLEDTPGATADPAGTYQVTIGDLIPPENVSVVKNGTTTTVSFTGTFNPASEYLADLVAPRTVGGEQSFYGRAFTPLLPASLPGLAGAVGSWGISESAGAPADIATALTIITGPTPPTPVTGTSPVFNHRDPDTNGLGGIGNFNNDFPILTNTASDDNFVVVGKTQITVAAPGVYTFSVHSDDGFAMRITGAGGGRFTSTGGDAQIDLGDNQTLHRNVGGADSNSRGVYQFDAAGTYNIEYLGWDGGAGGYYEVAWAPGGFSEDRNTNTWALVGSPNDPSVPPYQERWVTNLPGPVGTTGAFGTRTYKNAGTIGNLTNASDFLKTTTRTPADPGDGLTIDAQLPYLNHRDPQDGGGGGLIPGDLPIPGDTAENEANVVTVAKGRITIPTTSTYTFSYAGDDGFLLRIKGVAGNPDPAFKRATGFGTFQMSDPNELFYDPNGAIATRGIIDLAAGQYDLEFIQFEGGGAFFYELTAAEGSWPDQTTPPGGFQLVGFVPPAATVVIPGIAEPGWSVETGTPNTGAYGSNIAGAELRIDNTPVGIRTSIWDTLNFTDPEGGADGSFTPNNPFPLNTNVADDNYSMRATGILNVTVAGDYHLGFQGDDGGYMYIYGHNGTTDPEISSIVSTNVPTFAVIAVAPGSSVNNAILADTGTGNSRTIVSVPLAVGQYRIQTLVFEGVGGSWWEVIGAKGPLDASFNIPLLAKGPGTTVNLTNGLALVEQPPVVPVDPTFGITSVVIAKGPPTTAQLTFGSQDGVNYSIQASTDLVSWTTVVPNVAGTGSATTTNVDLSGFPDFNGMDKVFFRIQQ
ncbi:LamG-like jellyroll fold domain-containing protein [Luteolibacter sp. Populi]|uniref:LamG-like jellyroll fold domain-containing protein n=1 Tax=Luteolibacter sp. Populi TaxID=3230487 RepID=UPI003464F4F8